MDSRQFKDHEGNREEPTSEKATREYRKPILTEYGKVAQLTGGRPGTTRDFGGTSPAFPG